MAKGAQVTRELARNEFEALTKDYVDKIEEKCRSTIQKAVGEVSGLSGIVPVGGATRMHSIQEMIERLAGGVPVLHDVSPDLAIAQGAAITAHEEAGKPTEFLPIKKMQDVANFDVGIAAHRLTEPDPNKMFIGCIIPKGTPLPATASRCFGVTSMPSGAGAVPELTVCEGREGQEYEEKMKIQSFPLTGLALGSDTGKPRIKVTISVDKNGIITAEAIDLETGQQIRCQVDKKAIG
jgi:molecular chaperone DnaK (HSP70)